MLVFDDEWLLPSNKLPNKFVAFREFCFGEPLFEPRREVTRDVTREATRDAIFETIFDAAFVTVFAGSVTALLPIVLSLPTILAFRHLRRARDLLCKHFFGWLVGPQVVLFGDFDVICLIRDLRATYFDVIDIEAFLEFGSFSVFSDIIDWTVGCRIILFCSVGAFLTIFSSWSSLFVICRVATAVSSSWNSRSIAWSTESVWLLTWRHCHKASAYLIIIRLPSLMFLYFFPSARRILENVTSLLIARS